MLRLSLACLFCASAMSFAVKPLQMMRGSNDVNDFTSEFSMRAKKNPLLKIRTSSGRSLSKIKPEKNLSCDLKIKSSIEAPGDPLTCYFEKSSSCSSSKCGICPVDNRPCDANRVIWTIFMEQDLCRNRNQFSKPTNIPSNLRCICMRQLQ